jgi:hypothetical protein
MQKKSMIVMKEQILWCIENMMETGNCRARELVQRGRRQAFSRRSLSLSGNFEKISLLIETSITLYSLSRHVVFFWKEIARRVAERNELAGGEDAVDEAKVNTMAAFPAHREREKRWDLARNHTERVYVHTPRAFILTSACTGYTLSWRERERWRESEH